MHQDIKHSDTKGRAALLRADTTVYVRAVFASRRASPLQAGVSSPCSQSLAQLLYGAVLAPGLFAVGELDNRRWELQVTQSKLKLAFESQLLDNARRLTSKPHRSPSAIGAAEERP